MSGGRPPARSSLYLDPIVALAFGRPKFLYYISIKRGGITPGETGGGPALSSKRS